MDIQKLIEMIVSISPHVWDVLLKQVYVEAFQSLAIAGICATICFLLFKLAKHLWNDDAELGMIAGAGSVLSGILACTSIMRAIMWFANPEFYAIRYLLSQLPGN